MAKIDVETYMHLTFPTRSWNSARFARLVVTDRTSNTIIFECELEAKTFTALMSGLGVPVAGEVYSPENIGKQVVRDTIEIRKLYGKELQDEIQRSIDVLEIRGFERKNISTQSHNWGTSVTGRTWVEVTVEAMEDYADQRKQAFGE